MPEGPEIRRAADAVEQLDRIVKQGGHRGRGEALSALIRAHSESLHVENTSSQAIGKSLHVDRKFDSKRCECRTAKGGRCKLPTLAIIKKRVDDQVMAFGACKRPLRATESEAKARSPG